MSTDTNEKWKFILSELEKQFNKKLDMNALLLIIGIRELGSLKDSLQKKKRGV